MTILGYNPKSLILSFAIIVPLLFSCKEKENAATETSTAPTELSLEQKKQMLNQVTPATSTSRSVEGVTLNPPHGQPGHRCDIEVGAPLNAAAGNLNPMQQSPINVNNTTPIKSSPMPTSSSGTGGINPPHGEPGHRCDVKVGDPL
ncbi:MAG: hypothetical protein WBA61_12470 [Aequorivita sp.]